MEIWMVVVPALGTALNLWMAITTIIRRTQLEELREMYGLKAVTITIHRTLLLEFTFVAVHGLLMMNSIMAWGSGAEISGIVRMVVAGLLIHLSLFDLRASYRIQRIYMGS